MAFNPEEVIEQFESLSMDAGGVQEETLRRILQESSETEYLRKCCLNGRTDSESFKACIPLVSYKDLELFIQRIADGDANPILTAKPITAMSRSIGTTEGKPKFIPFNDDLMDTAMKVWKTSYAFRNRDFPIGKGKALQFIYGSERFKTKGGLDTASATIHVYTNKLFAVMIFHTQRTHHSYR